MRKIRWDVDDAAQGVGEQGQRQGEEGEKSAGRGGLESQGWKRRKQRDQQQEIPENFSHGRMDRESM